MQPAAPRKGAPGRKKTPESNGFGGLSAWKGKRPGYNHAVCRRAGWAARGRFIQTAPFCIFTKSRPLAVISTQAGRKPLRMAFRTDRILDQAAQ